MSTRSEASGRRRCRSVCAIGIALLVSSSLLSAGMSPASAFVGDESRPEWWDRYRDLHAISGRGSSIGTSESEAIEQAETVARRDLEHHLVHLLRSVGRAYAQATPRSQDSGLEGLVTEFAQRSGHEIAREAGIMEQVSLQREGGRIEGLVLCAVPESETIDRMTQFILSGLKDLGRSTMSRDDVRGRLARAVRPEAVREEVRWRDAQGAIANPDAYTRRAVALLARQHYEEALRVADQSHTAMDDALQRLNRELGEVGISGTQPSRRPDGTRPGKQPADIAAIIGHRLGRAAVTLSLLRSSPTSNSEMGTTSGRTGYAIGLARTYRTGQVGVNVEGRYIVRGYNFDELMSGHARIEHFSFNPSVVIRLGRAGLLIGPESAILVRAEGFYEGPSGDSRRISLSDRINSTDFGVRLGCEYVLNSRVCLLGSLYFGLTPLHRKKAEAGERLVARDFSIALGFRP